MFKKKNENPDNEANKKIINTHLNESVFSDDKEVENRPLRLYEEIPEKLGLRQFYKSRKLIKFFINYKLMTYSPTLVERKILEEINKEVRKCNSTYPIRLIVFFSFIATFKKTYSMYYLNLLFLLISMGLSGQLGSIFFTARLNSILMKCQINDYYSLGRETKKLIHYVKSEKTSQEETDEDIEFFKHLREIKDFYEVKFRPRDKLHDYSNSNEQLDLYGEVLNKLEKNRLKALKDKEKEIRESRL